MNRATCYLCFAVLRPLWSMLLVCACMLPSHGKENTLSDQLRPLLEKHAGKATAAVKHLGTGDVFQYDAEKVMPTASLIKFPLMVATYQAAAAGDLDMEQLVTLEAEDKVPGSGILTAHFSPGTRISLRDAVHLMMVYSDNTATNLVVDQIGLPATATLMEKLGLPDTKLHSKVFKRDTSVFPKRSAKFGLGSSTAGEIVRLLELLHTKKLASPEVCDAMLSHMYECDDRLKLSRYLPSGTKVAQKTGSVDAVRCAGGIIESPDGPIAVCVMTAENEDRSWGDKNAGDLLCARVASAVYRYFNSAHSATELEEPQPLAMGANGSMVEDLQRTLNARLRPSPELSVDGDYGPNTEAAVVRFQEERNLPATGVVGPEAWAALGPLVTQDEPVPPPSEINARAVEKETADALEGPPFVTCRGWAIGDGETGNLLWGENETARLDPASTTKIMTGYLVALLAQEEPGVLDEEVTFSKRADETIGSTSGVRAGEKLTVRELLYGLLLPSGNDASVAFGEHFGERLSQRLPTSARTMDPLQNFVAAMNDKANELGMTQTAYCNTHGLTAEGHQTSAADLLTLTHHAMQLPLFREVVRTSQRGCSVTSKAGYSRNLLWKNTNRLLGVDGYCGVKTGTTSAAGACLVSQGEREDRSLIVVVLGSTASDSRYADTRNLYRWAWRQLEAEEAGSQ